MNSFTFTTHRWSNLHLFHHNSTKQLLVCGRHLWKWREFNNSPLGRSGHFNSTENRREMHSTWLGLGNTAISKANTRLACQKLIVTLPIPLLLPLLPYLCTFTTIPTNKLLKQLSNSKKSCTNESQLSTALTRHPQRVTQWITIIA